MLLTFKKTVSSRGNNTQATNTLLPLRNGSCLPGQQDDPGWRPLPARRAFTSTFTSKQTLRERVIGAFFPVYLLTLFELSRDMEQPGVHQREVEALR